MNISSWSIRHPIPPIATFLVLCIVGLISFKQLSITRFPNIDVPIITVSVGQAGAAPSELVSQVTKTIEDALSSVAGVKHITSVASDSLSLTTIEFDLDVDTDRALNDIKDAVTRVRDQLPESIIEPQVQRVDVTGLAIMTYAATDPTQSIEDLSYFIDDVVARKLQSIKSIGRVTRGGGADREIKVELDPDRLLAFNITASEISSQLRAKNINLGGGRGDLGGQEFSIRTLGSVSTVTDLALTPISLNNGRTVLLDDLGSVVDGPAEMRSFALLDGEPVVAFSVFRSYGASDVVAAKEVKQRIDELVEEFPNLGLSIIDDTTIYTLGNFKSSMTTLYEGAILAIIVVFIFLGNWRATLISALALPLSIIPTFLVMQMLGFSLNTISLLGITLVTGVLVDDAIVEIENIIRHIQMGKTAYQAAKEAANEIGLAVVAISLTIVAVFTPVSFMSGIAGQYFRQFGLTVAISVLFSLAVARFITPMLAAYVLRDSVVGHKISKDGILMRSYLAVLAWTLKHRTTTLVFGLAIFVGSLYSATLLPTDFVPASDEGRSLVSIELPSGSTINDTFEKSREISRVIGQKDEVESVYIDADGGDITRANLVVTYVSKEDRDLSSHEIEDQLKQKLANIADVKIRVLGPNGQRDISIIILGEDQGSITEAADTLVQDLKNLTVINDVSNTASLSRPEIRIIPKAELAASLGITASSVASTIRISTIGDSDVNLAKFNTGERQIPIVVRMNEDVRRDLTKMTGTRIKNASGKSIPLSVVAEFVFSEGPGSIERYDRFYRTTVEADLANNIVLGPALDAIYTTQTALDMPLGTSIQRGGDAEVMSEIFTGFALAMGLGIMLVYVVLVILFDSFITPITILLSLPLCVGGAIFALYLFNKPISLPVIIGFLMLMGIVTKNAIMLVEFAIQGMSGGVERNQALLDAGHKRARPIIMTTIAMVAGMVPSALALGVGGEFRSPMAIAVIGGLIVSTILSLLFVPALFSVINSLKTRLRRGLTKILGQNSSKIVKIAES